MVHIIVHLALISVLFDAVQSDEVLKGTLFISVFFLLKVLQSDCTS